MQRFLQKHADRIVGVLSGFDRMRFRGTLREVAYTQGMDTFLRRGGVLLKHFYLRHAQFGFMHLRLQTWFPFSIHLAINGREWLAGQLEAAGIGYRRADNCFLG